MEGEEHRKVRSKTARFFSPRMTRQVHVKVIQDASAEALAVLHKKGRVPISFLSMRVATRVAAHIVGLTNSQIDGLERRLTVIGRAKALNKKRLSALFPWIRQQYAQLSMFLRDLRPAIAARRAQPQDDLISHLIDEGYKPGEIMGEALTYGTAGVITTRQFICACVWYLHQDAELRSRFMQADDTQSDAILYEILRLEPVVGRLKRQSTEAICVEHEGKKINIKEKSRISFEVYDINADPEIMGEDPNSLCPHRAKGSKRPPTFSFGAGHHRCPGEYVAMLETRIFLKALFAIPGLKVVGKPELEHNETIEGYEIEGLWAEV